jgi:hypothetical protein
MRKTLDGSDNRSEQYIPITHFFNTHARLTLVDALPHPGSNRRGSSRKLSYSYMNGNRGRSFQCAARNEYSPCGMLTDNVPGLQKCKVTVSAALA